MLSQVSLGIVDERAQLVGEREVLLLLVPEARDGVGLGREVERADGAVVPGVPSGGSLFLRSQRRDVRGPNISGLVFGWRGFTC